MLSSSTLQTTSAEPMSAPEFVSVATAAKLISVSDVSIRRFLTQKRLRRFKVGGRTLVKFVDLMALVKEVK